MSHMTVFQSVSDLQLQQRVTAAACKEAYLNVDKKDTQVAKAIRQNPGISVQLFIWAVAIEYEAQYAYAVDPGNEHPSPTPGADSLVISDGNITASVVAHWPTDEQYEESYVPSVVGY